MHFTRQELWLTKLKRNFPYLRVDYADARALEFEGGIVRSGGGYAGGGFGLIGAVEGVAMAALLNRLTSKSAVHTTIRFEATDAEVFLFTDQAAPKTLMVRFAEVRAKIKAGTSALPRSGPGTETDDDLTGQLVRLGGLFEKGLLTADEFASAKARLLG